VLHASSQMVTEDPQLPRWSVPRASQVLEAFFANIESGPAYANQSAPELTSEHMACLVLLCQEKNLLRALQLVDKGLISMLQAQPSGRTVFQVQGKTVGEHYLCLPMHFCTCHAFFFDIVSRSEAIACKHVLAARIAQVLKRCRKLVIQDTEMANLLNSY